MFVRKKRNKSNSVSIQIIDKSRGAYKVVKTLGSSRDREEIEHLWHKAYNLIPELTKQSTLNLLTKNDRIVLDFLKDTDNLKIRNLGPELVFGGLFDAIGFDTIPEELFRHLVITRLVYPGSKLKTIDYLYRHKDISVGIQTVYRFLDRLRGAYKAKIENIAFKHTKRILRDNITVVFYDLTTLYFETSEEDELRKMGFSKDGKFQKPQILLGLLVGEHGYPIGYDIFEGNTFEGHTFIPVLEQIRNKYKIDKPIIITDAALLSQDNIKQLTKRKYTYILGARIKNESNTIKEKILARQLQAGERAVIKREDGTKLIVTQQEKRAKKDRYNRERGLRKLETKIQTGKLTKKHINNRGYNKYLVLEGKVDIKIDYDKFEADADWDGLKGYITNTKLSLKKVVEHYNHLWRIEQAFRISKTDLRVRPIFHRLHHRIEAHISIAFVAYTVYKELERILRQYKAPFSVKRAVKLTENIYELEFILPETRQNRFVRLGISDEQKVLLRIIEKYCKVKR